jgi:aminopeptidase N/puromycin-sensitive aminopeptidase
LQKVYETSIDPEIQIGALRLLAMFEDPELVNRSLEYAISNKVRNQDAAVQLAIPLEIDESREQAWKYIQAHWEKVQAQLTTNSGSILIGSTSGFCSNSGRQDVERFFSAHKVAASGQSLKHAIEHIDGCIELRSLQEPKLKTWLATQPRSATGASMH